MGHNDYDGDLPPSVKMYGQQRACLTRCLPEALLRGEREMETRLRPPAERGSDRTFLFVAWQRPPGEVVPDAEFMGRLPAMLANPESFERSPHEPWENDVRDNLRDDEVFREQLQRSLAFGNGKGVYERAELGDAEAIAEVVPRAMRLMKKAPLQKLVHYGAPVSYAEPVHYDECWKLPAASVDQLVQMSHDGLMAESECLYRRGQIGTEPVFPVADRGRQAVADIEAERRKLYLAVTRPEPEAALPAEPAHRAPQVDMFPDALPIR